MTINEYWVANHREEKNGFTSCPRLTCKSGLDMSVQASKTHYCNPREYMPKGGYTSFEVGYPTEVVEELMPYVEDADRPLDTVYGYVPAHIIDAVIEKNGGLA